MTSDHDDLSAEERRLRDFIQGRSRQATAELLASLTAFSFWVDFLAPRWAPEGEALIFGHGVWIRCFV